MSTATSAANNRPAFDQERADAFGERLLGMLNAGSLCLMTSLGHRSGLFDTLAGMAPASSKEIAGRAGLDERYVREWLAAMVVGRFIDYDPGRDTYRLPPEHAASLTRDSTSGNFAVYGQFVALLGRVEEDILHCFRHGGGVPYGRYDRFHEVMAEDSAQTVLPALETDILPLVPGLRERLESGIRVLDVGCGRGKAVNALASLFPNSRFVGYDFSEEAIAFARDESRARGNANASFEVRDVSDFDRTAERGTVDLVTTFDAVHDQKAPLAVLRGIRNSLADDGVYLAQDIKGSSHLHGDLDHPL
ncbi:MAG: class I SAM-dependent methyltransferase, partial [Kiloniellales bacterium]